MRVALTILTAGTVLAMIPCLIRLALGPKTPSRVVALDGLTTISTVLLALVALWSGRLIYLDIALVYAVLAFTGGLVIARYLEKGI